MNIFGENDIVRLLRGVEANIITGGEVFIAEGAEGTIVVVYGSTDKPSAYELEFFIPECNGFALATVDADSVCGV